MASRAWGEGKEERRERELEKLKLPDDFFFGAAMSGPQTEGE